MIRRALILAASLLGATAAVGALAQDVAQKDAPPPMLDLLRKDMPAEIANQIRRGGALFQAYAMLGREDRIAAERNGRLRPTCRLVDGDAVSEIARRAAEAQIVMMNEAHDAPRDRAFIAEVVKALKAFGYNTYAAETFSDDAATTTLSYPRLSDGYYSSEPAFGDLFRMLRSSQMRLVSYEDRGPPVEDRHFTNKINARESAQASNFINRTVRDTPDLKVLVHVGYSHNREEIEKLDGRDVLWLAHRLKEITGIDPLTIDQTTYVAERSGVCLSNSDGSTLPTDRDIYVAHSPLAFERGRPTWRLARGQRFADIPRALKKPDERVIYEARYASEPDDAVPADRILVDPGEDIPLLLAPGRYRVRAWTQDGAWTRSLPLTVAAPTPAAPQKAKAKTQRSKKK